MCLNTLLNIVANKCTISSCLSNVWFKPTAAICFWTSSAAHCIFVSHFIHVPHQWELIGHRVGESECWKMDYIVLHFCMGFVGFHKNGENCLPYPINSLTLSCTVKSGWSHLYTSNWDHKLMRKLHWSHRSSEKKSHLFSHKPTVHTVILFLQLMESPPADH